MMKNKKIFGYFLGIVFWSMFFFAQNSQAAIQCCVDSVSGAQSMCGNPTNGVCPGTSIGNNKTCAVLQSEGVCGAKSIKCCVNVSEKKCVTATSGGTCISGYTQSNSSCADVSVCNSSDVTECQGKGGTCVQSTSACPDQKQGASGFGCGSGQMCCGLSAKDSVCCVNSSAKSCQDSDDYGNCNTASGYVATAGSCDSLKASTCNFGVGGGSGSGGLTGIVFPNPIPFKTIAEVLNSILTNMMGIIALIAMIFIIIGGILYMTSAGDEKRMTRAKNTWTAAVIGFAIAIAAPTFLKEIKKILGDKNGKTADDWVDKALTIKQIALNVMEFLLGVIGIFALIAMVVGGFYYLTAYGDEERAKSGKKIITWAIAGILVSLAALVILRQVAKLIGATAFM